MRFAPFVFVLGSTTFFVSAPAWGGLLARTRSGAPVRWQRSEVVLRPAPPPSQTRVSSAALRAELEAAAEAWNRTLERRSAPRIRIGPEAPASAIRQDGMNVVVLRTGRWCPDAARDEDDCYDKRRSAITHLHPVDAPGSARDGELGEVDIEINAVDFAWQASLDASRIAPLRAVLAHELGHVLGLDHSCAASPVPAAPAPGLPLLAPCIDPASKLSIMYPDPIERGRPFVLAPSEDEEKTLGRIYGERRMGCACDGATVPCGPDWTVGIVIAASLVARRRHRWN